MAPPPQPATTTTNSKAKPRQATTTARHEFGSCLRRVSVQEAKSSVKAKIHKAGVKGISRINGGNRRPGTRNATGCVVLQDTVTVVPRLAGLGDAVQVDSDGAPVMFKLTDPVNPPRLARFKLNDAVCPCATVADVEEPAAGLKEKSSAVPLSETVCVLPATPSALSVIVSAPANAPPAFGAKVTLIVHELLAATLLPQLLVWLKLALVTMLVTARVVEPPFVSVTGCNALVVPSISVPNVRLRGDKVSEEAINATVPDTLEL